ncbi:MAG: PepSY-like domain-containing protein [Bacteroidales bacterium]|jgi:hypothetical protein|nr:PepSY-like domain-containing protein [Bacteroidales bacterium]MBO7180007.1 PepSY-like domain-containing protein [Bacteroidales bacterium]MBQ1191241.1 PepSY-like domain-containing protein [Bacteroidales bacterium]MEE0895428.1 PepSY-like domain-containing protein [Bacteroidales bacterium]MEE0910277.1 PepSY-like domain-containing protein [Bacteroidales bacterium]
MKKLIMVIMAAFAFFSCESSNPKLVEFSQLPANAQSIIKTHFADKVISTIFYENDLFDKDYEVRFEDGSKIDFDGNGEWTNIEVKKNGGVPVGVIPSAINSYVSSKHPNHYVIDIEKDCREYNVELNNGIDMVFGKNGNFKRYDD